jgi:hypothetical protein
VCPVTNELLQGSVHPPNGIGVSVPGGPASEEYRVPRPRARRC